MKISNSVIDNIQIHEKKIPAIFYDVDLDYNSFRTVRTAWFYTIQFHEKNPGNFLPDMKRRRSWLFSL